MLEKISIADSVEVTESGCVNVRIATRILENNEIISQSFHRHVIAPGEDYSNEDSRVQSICAAVHTPEVVATYQSSHT